MSRTKNSLQIADYSLFCKNLLRSWPDKKPGHLTVMNLVAQSSGYKNYQHYLSMADTEVEVEFSAKEKRWLRLIDDNGRITRWPTKYSDQLALLWLLSSQLPNFSDWSEKQVNAWLQEHIAIDDYVMVRRELIGLRVLARTRNGRRYWVEPFEVPEEYQNFSALTRSP